MEIRNTDFAIFMPTTKEYVSEVGGARLGKSYTINIKIKNDQPITGLHFCITQDGENKFSNIYMKKVHESENYDTYSCSFTPYKTGLFFYAFSFFDGRFVRHITKYKNNRTELDGHYYFQLTVYPEEVKAPSLSGGVIYQIFPDRFAIGGIRHEKVGAVNRYDWGGEPYFHFVDGIMPNNDHFGGNFQGISDHMEYIKSLGVKYIYLNPIYKAESNHKYDVGNFMMIDECFGGEEAFKEFIAVCKENGIAVIMDHVFNHAGENSIYFNKSGKYGNNVGAYRNKKSEYFDWFTFKEYPDKYNCWWGIELLPEIDDTSESYREYLCGDGGVVDKYLEMGVGGFRLDVVDEISDDLLEKITDKVRKYDGAFLIGEVWEDASNKIAYEKRRNYFTKNLLDGVMNYVWRDGIIDFVREGGSLYFMQKIIDIVSNYPSHNLAQTMNMISSHDSVRILTAVAGEKRERMTREEMSVTSLSSEELEKGKQLVKMAYLLSYTLPGVPSLYYGDENLSEGYTDPFNRRCMDFETKDKNFFEFFQKIGKLREHKVFESSELHLAELSDRSICFSRICDTHKMFVCANRGEEITLQRERVDILTGKTYQTVGKDQFVLTIEEL